MPMETKIEKLPQSRIRTLTTITDEERLEAEKLALASLAEHVDIKGFRVGKAPGDMVRSRVGEEKLTEETVRALLPKVLKEALEKSGAKPILRPAASVTSTKPLTIALTFVERPPVTLKKPDSIKIEKNTFKESTDAEVESFIRKILIQDRAETPVERAAKEGDLVNLAMVATKKGAPVEELTVGHYNLVIGSEDLLPQLEAHATGMKKGDKKTVDVTFPKEHDIPAIRGEKISIEMTAKGVSEIKLPELTQEYLKTRLGSDMTPDAFRGDVKKMLLDRKKSEEMKRREEDLYEKVRASTQVDYAPEILDAEVQDMVQDLHGRLEQQKISMDDWLKATGKDPKSVVDEMKQIAGGRIVLRFGMQELAGKLNIDADPKLMEVNLAAARKNSADAGNPIPEEELKAGGTVYEQIRFDLRMQALVGNMINDEAPKAKAA